MCCTTGGVHVPGAYLAALKHEAHWRFEPDVRLNLDDPDRHAHLRFFARVRGGHLREVLRHSGRTDRRTQVAGR